MTTSTKSLISSRDRVNIARYVSFICLCVIAFLGITIVAGAVMSDSHAETATKSDKAFALSYTKQIGEHEYSYVVIDIRGNVQSYTAYTQTGMTPRALGWHYLPLGHDDPNLEAIGRIIRKNELIGGKVYKMHPKVVGLRTKVFSIKADGQQVIHVFDAHIPLPDGFIELEQNINRLFSNLAAAPLRALVLTVSVDPVQVVPGDSVKIKFDFGCLGKFPLDFRNPAYLERGGGSLKLNLWKRRLGKDGEHLDYSSTIELAGNEFLFEERKAVPSGEMFLRISPGERMLMWTTIRFPKISPETYIIEPIYYGMPMHPWELQKHPDFIAGELHADLKEFVVLKIK
jgi:hypothetical protein